VIVGKVINCLDKRVCTLKQMLLSLLEQKHLEFLLKKGHYNSSSIEIGAFSQMQTSIGITWFLLKTNIKNPSVDF
jgi:hypothetical protein